MHSQHLIILSNQTTDSLEAVVSLTPNGAAQPTSFQFTVPASTGGQNATYTMYGRPTGIGRYWYLNYDWSVVGTGAPSPTPSLFVLGPSSAPMYQPPPVEEPTPTEDKGQVATTGLVLVLASACVIFF